MGNTIAKFSIMNQIESLPPTLRYPLKKLIYFPFSIPVGKPTLDLDLQKRLIKYLKDDMDSLRKFTGRTFNKWSI